MQTDLTVVLIVLNVFISSTVALAAPYSTITSKDFEIVISLQASQVLGSISRYGKEVHTGSYLSFFLKVAKMFYFYGML